MPKPDLQKVPAFYHSYVTLVKQDNISKAFSKHSDAISFLKKIPKKKWDYRYAEGKWSIKQLIQHVIDAERIFSYRALRIARKDTTPLPAFDEEKFAAVSKADKRTKKDLIRELETVQQSSRRLFESFDEEQLQAGGTVSNNSIDVNAIGFVIIGHTLHHLNILKERYLKKGRK
ncbi:MAG: DinB family protein [Chitinophagaceae bacterium]|nr:DinB family protein [Chitinophagaceae bacterium]